MPRWHPGQLNHNLWVCSWVLYVLKPPGDSDEQPGWKQVPWEYTPGVSVLILWMLGIWWLRFSSLCFSIVADFSLGSMCYFCNDEWVTFHLKPLNECQALLKSRQQPWNEGGILEQDHNGKLSGGHMLPDWGSESDNTIFVLFLLFLVTILIFKIVSQNSKYHRKKSWAFYV